MAVYNGAAVTLIAVGAVEVCLCGIYIATPDAPGYITPNQGPRFGRTDVGLGRGVIILMSWP